MLLAEVPSAAWVNMQSAEHLCLRVSGPPGPGMGGGGRVKHALKPSLDRKECVSKISSRSVQGVGFPLALHIPTDGQTNKHLQDHFYLYVIVHNLI